jgi:ribosomal protein S12 methylthiotransferase
VPEVLARMNRRGAIEASLLAADVLREAVPGVTLRTTIMTGFPGETPVRFQRLMSDLKRMQFDRLGAFAFSPEKGTAAATMPGRPSRRTAEERERAVMRLAADIWRLRAQRLVGQTFRALVVAPGVARLESQAPDVDGVTYVDGAAEVGEFVDVRLTGVRGFDLEGALA